MALLDNVKTALRVDGTDLNTEIEDLINAAKIDLNLAGVYDDKMIESDSFIKLAVITFCKANFSYDDPRVAERFQNSYEMIKTRLALSSDYSLYTVTFNTGEQCKVTFNGETKETNVSGIAKFYTRAKNHIPYSYLDTEGYVDVSEDVTVGGA